MNNQRHEILTELHGLFVHDRPGLIARCETLLAENPDFTPAMMMLALVSLVDGNEGLAINFLEGAHAVAPDCKEYVDLLSMILPRVGRLADSLYFAKLSLSMTPDLVLAPFVPRELGTYKAALANAGISKHGMRADISLRRGMVDDALTQAYEELRIDSGSVRAMIVIGRALSAKGAGKAAINMLRAAVNADPRSAWVHVWLAEALIGAAQHVHALPHLRLAIQLDPTDKALAAQASGLTEWLDHGDWLAAQDVRGHLEQLIAMGRGTKTPAAIPASDMIGLVTDQSHAQPLNPMLIPVIKEHEKTVLYRISQRSDAFTDVYRHAVLRVRDCADLDTFTLGRTMLGDHVAAYVTLSNPSAESRLVRFSGQGGSASVQWLSFPLADRLPTAELVVGDAETADIDQKTFGDDAIITLDQLAVYKFPDPPAPDECVGDLPRDQVGHVTFAAWADFRRLSPAAVQLWARCLLAVPGSVLLLKGRNPWEEGALQFLHERFSEYGVGSRVELYQSTDPLESRLAFLAKADVLLDTLPVSGGHEVAEALWMGVPAVTLRGQRRAGRFGASVLRAAGRPDWIADDDAAYVQLAATLATSNELSALRAGLRADVTASPLAQIKPFAEQLFSRLLGKVADGVPGRA